MSDRNATDDIETPVERPITNAANRELAAVVADLVAEGKAHTNGVYEIYKTLCKMADEAPKSWGRALLEEYKRHAEKTNENLVSLSAVVT